MNDNNLAEAYYVTCSIVLYIL